MASNRLPQQIDRLFALADDMIDGLHTHEVAIDVKQNTEAVLTPVLAAARSAEAAYGTCQTMRKAANATLKTADNGARTFISNARRRFAMFFGESYNTEWGAVGWPNGSTGVPSTQDERFSLVESIRIYLTSNPAHESADLGVTAALAATAHTAVSDARTALAQKITDSGNAKAARDGAVRTLRKRMSGLVDELETLLEGDDPLWHAFGLNRPADPDTPEPPSLLTLTPAGPGTALADWDDSLRAERYRVWLLIVGVDTDFQPIQTVNDSDATLDGLTTGATIRVRITAANDAGESQPGPEVEMVVP